MARSHNITIDGQSFEARHGELLLDAALNNGIDLPYDCRAGHCGTCCVRLVSGDVEGGEGSEPGIVHACQCRIASDAVLESNRQTNIRAVEGVLSSLRPLSSEVIEVGIKTDRALPLSCWSICAGVFQRLSAPSLQHYSSAARRSGQQLYLVPCPAHGRRPRYFIARQAHQAGTSGDFDRAVRLGTFPAQSGRPPHSRRHQYWLRTDLVHRRRRFAREAGAKDDDHRRRPDYRVSIYGPSPREARTFSQCPCRACLQCAAGFARTPSCPAGRPTICRDCCRPMFSTLAARRGWSSPSNPSPRMLVRPAMQILFCQMPMARAKVAF